MNLRRSATLFTLFVLCLPIGSRGWAEAPARTIEVHVHRFAFEPSEITVKAGEKVRLDLISDDVPHSLVVRDLGINEAVSKSHPSEVVFTPTRAGDFQGRCGRFCGSGHGRMTFTIHVTGE